MNYRMYAVFLVCSSIVFGQSLQAKFGFDKIATKISYLKAKLNYMNSYGSNEAIIGEAERILKKGHHQYDDLINSFEQLNGNANNPEIILESLSKIVTLNGSASPLSEIKLSLIGYDLQRSRTNAFERWVLLESLHNDNFGKPIEELKSLEEKIGLLLARVKLLKGFLSRHRDCSKFYDSYREVQRSYKQECSMLTSETLDGDINDTLQSYIEYDWGINSDFPYTAYLSTLKSNIDELDYILSKISEDTYPTLYHNLSSFLSTLCSLRKSVLNLNGFESKYKQESDAKFNSKIDNLVKTNAGLTETNNNLIRTNNDLTETNNRQKKETEQLSWKIEGLSKEVKGLRRDCLVVKEKK